MLVTAFCVKRIKRGAFSQLKCYFHLNICLKGCGRDSIPVLRLATGWKVRTLNDGSGRGFPRPFRPAPERNHPPARSVMGLFRGKATGA